MLWATVAGLAVLLCVPAAWAQVVPLGGEIVWSEDFEAGWGDWWSDSGIWDVGAPASGPDGAYSGSQCAATVLDGKYPYGPDSRLIGPQVQLPQVEPGEELLLRFRQWWSYQSVDRGYVQIQVYDEAAGAWLDWTTLKEVYSFDATWHHARVELTDYAGQRVRIGFYHTDQTEDPSGAVHHDEGLGWYIDDVEISPPPVCSTTLDISSTDGGLVVAPDEGEVACSFGEVVCLGVQAEDEYRFIRWEGTAVDAGRVLPDDTEPDACVTVDGNYTLKAVFEPIFVVIYDEPLDADPGWVLQGQWEFGVPTGQRCGAWGNNDPTSGHTGSNVVGVNLEGCYDLAIDGPHSATAGPFDLSGYSDITLQFWRWLNTDIPEYVRSTIEVSTDGQNWSVVWQQGEREEITDTEWTLCEYLIPEADLEPTVYVRWTYEVVQERAYAYTGWNLDDIQLIGAPK